MLPRYWGLQRRIMTYVAVGLLALFALVAGLTWRATRQSSALIAEQRLSLAEMLAIYLDGALRRASAEIDSASFTLSLLDDESAAPQAVLAQLRARLAEGGDVEVPGCLAVMSPAGETLVTEAGAAEGACEAVAARALVPRALADGRPVRQVQAPPAAGGFPCGPGPHGCPGARPVLAVAVPVGALPAGADTGVLVADIRPTLRGAALRPFLADADTDRGYRIEILAEGGAVDTSVAEPAAYAAAHWRLIAPRLRDGQAGLVEHVVPGRSAAGRHFVAFVPLTVAPWAVVVEQSHDLAFALPLALRNQMLAAGTLGLIAALGVAWLTTRQIIRPLSTLTAAAQRIARGDLDQAIRPAGHDEVHVLGVTLEEMRARLQALLAERDEWGRELERQVAARTRELEQRNCELAVASAENRRLYEQVLEQERQRRRLLERTMVAHEEERKRIARELHDEVGQALTALIMTLDSLTAREGRARGQRQALQGLRDLTNATLGEVRRVIAALRPSMLDDLGLVPAIHWYAKTTLGAAGVAYRIDAPSLNCRISSTVETALFRIAQEAITNVVRHAHACHVSIRLDRTPERAEVVVEDDGIGFDVRTIGANGHGEGARLHVGLLGMRERAELLGGQLALESSRGQGARIHAVIPLGSGTDAQGEENP